jgi:hypothetical protein
MKEYELPAIIENHLNTDPELSYIEATAIQDWETDPFPAFKDYCLIITPNSRKITREANMVRQRIINLDLVCIVRNFDPRLSIIGDQPGHTGIMKMIRDVEESVESFLENAGEIDFELDEMDEPVDYKTQKLKDLEGFFRIHILPLSIRFEHEIGG